jgi:error-prone DNA polymerase
MIPLTTRSHYSLMWGTDSRQRSAGHCPAHGIRPPGPHRHGQPLRPVALCPPAIEEGTHPHRGRRGHRSEQADLPRRLPGQKQRPVTPTCAACSPGATGTRHSICPEALPHLAGGLLVLVTRRADLLTAWHRMPGSTRPRPCPATPLPFPPLVRGPTRLGIPLVATPGSFFLQPGRIRRAPPAAGHRRQHHPFPAAARHGARKMPGWHRPEEYTGGSPPARRPWTTPASSPKDLPSPARHSAWSCRRGRQRRAQRRQPRPAPRPPMPAPRRYGEDLPEPWWIAWSTSCHHRPHEFLAPISWWYKTSCRSPRTCGRGSGAASLVAYCLGITNVCPVKHNLYFGRFLNPGRTDPPDIDVDFAWDERDDGHRRRAGPVCRPCRHGLQPHPVPAPHGRAGNGQGFRPARCRDRPGHPAPALVLAFTGTGAGLISDLPAAPGSPHLDFIHPWPRDHGPGQQLIGIPATSPSIPAGW